MVLLENFTKHLKIKQWFYTFPPENIKVNIFPNFYEVSNILIQKQTKIVHKKYSIISLVNFHRILNKILESQILKTYFTIWLKKLISNSTLVRHSKIKISNISTRKGRRNLQSNGRSRNFWQNLLFIPSKSSKELKIEGNFLKLIKGKDAEQ